MAELPIPSGFGVPLVDLATGRLPEPTMLALGRSTRPQVAAVIRNSGAGWAVIDDEGHTPVGVASVETFADRIVVNFAESYSEILTAYATTDETLASKGYTCGPSVGLSSMTIWLTKPGGLYDYVYWDATLNEGTGGWKSINGVFTFERILPSGAATSPTTIDPTLGLQLGHAPVELTQGLAAVVNARGTKYIGQAGSLGVDRTFIDVFDRATLARPAVPDVDMKFWAHRVGTVRVDPTTVVETSGNVWLAVFAAK